MKNFLILIALTVGLVSTSFIKNKTRLLDKELINLNKEINSLNYNLQDLNLEFEFITSPKNISLLAKEFLDEDFTYYKISQIKEIDKKKKNSSNLKSAKKINLNIPKKTTYADTDTDTDIDTDTELSKKVITEDPNKFKRWVGIQVLKFVVGFPTVPAK